MNAIRKALDQAGFEEVRIGTADKFQGHEGMVVIVSLACSSADDAPRGLDFLLDRNRLNVAISRGESLLPHSLKEPAVSKLLVTGGCEVCE